MADISAMKPNGAGGASYNFKDAAARVNINILFGQDQALDTRVTALENAPSGGGVNIYRIAGPVITNEDLGNSVNGVVYWNSENRAWGNDYDDTSFQYVPLTSLMPQYPNASAPSVNAGDILINFEEGYGFIKSVLAVMNSATVPSIVLNCINSNPDATSAEKTAFFNSLISAYNKHGTLLVVATGRVGAGVFGYFYEG